MRKRVLAITGLLALTGVPALAQTAPAFVAYQVVERNGVPTVPQPLTDTPGDPKEGAKVVAGRTLGNCLSCHEISALQREEFHGEVGPSLDGVAQRWEPAMLRAIVVNAKLIFTSESVMPAFHRIDGLNRVRGQFSGKPILSPQQVEDVVAFLGTLK